MVAEPTFIQSQHFKNFWEKGNGKQLLDWAEYKVDVEKFKNHKILDIVDQITLSIMDGSIVKYDRESDYYKLVMSFISIPSKIFKKNIDFKKLIFAVDAVLTGGRYNNQHDTL